MAPRHIRPDQIAEVLPAGGLTWLQACSGESPLIRDGLAAWQKRTVVAYMEEHLAEEISLGMLADLPLGQAAIDKAARA